MRAVFGPEDTNRRAAGPIEGRDDNIGQKSLEVSAGGIVKHLEPNPFQVVRIACRRLLGGGGEGVCCRGGRNGGRGGGKKTTAFHERIETLEFGVGNPTFQPCSGRIFGSTVPIILLFHPIE